MNEIFPDPESLIQSVGLQRIINDSLLAPVVEFCNRPAKNIRSKLVELGYRLAMPDENFQTTDARENLQIASSIIEYIHSGSLIVDDIQDESATRRNAPALHVLHGTPLALNAGNWLYFWALTRIKELSLTRESESNLTRDIVNLMMRAHTGQAIDLGTMITDLSKAQVKETCLASMELKTGALFSMAMRLGTAVSGDPEERPQISGLGVRLGVLLQMMDDIGNLFADSSKKFEDIYHKRPTWIWAVASDLKDQDYAAFVKATQSPESLLEWIEKNNFRARLKEETQKYKNEIIAMLRHEWQVTHPETIKEITEMIFLLEKAYE